MEDKPTKQPKRVSPISGVAPPDGFEKYPERRNNGAWSKPKTARYKFEKMLEMGDEELLAVRDDASKSRFERSVAKVLIMTGEAKNLAEANIALAMLERIVNQVYGQPKNKSEVELNGEVKGINLNVKDYRKDG